jgi:hypothetical protein
MDLATALREPSAPTMMLATTSLELVWTLTQSLEVLTSTKASPWTVAAPASRAIWRRERSSLSRITV